MTKKQIQKALSNIGRELDKNSFYNKNELKAFILNAIWQIEQIGILEKGRVYEMLKSEKYNCLRNLEEILICINAKAFEIENSAADIRSHLWPTFAVFYIAFVGSYMNDIISNK